MDVNWRGYYAKRAAAVAKQENGWPDVVGMMSAVLEAADIPAAKKVEICQYILAEYRAACLAEGV